VLKVKSGYKKITPKRHFFDFDLPELWERRALLLALVSRDIQVRYRNTFLGVAWAILQPVLATLIFTLIFTTVFNFDSDGEGNYLVYTLIGFIFWQFFSGGVAQAAISVYEQIGMVKKIYFPRLFLPLTVIIRSLFDLLVASIFLIGAMVFTQTPITAVGALGFILTMMIFFIFASGVSFIFSSLNARYRDFRHLIPFVIQIWFYATPVFYATTLLAGRLEWLLTLNPVAQALILARQAIFAGVIDWPQVGGLFLVSLLVLILGMGIFKNLETEMVDWA
jgi:lipopolysaccharide transport system permease protein